MNTTENQKWQLDLLRELIRTSFKLRYNDSVLGFIWVILKPLLTFTVLFIVFSNFKSDVYGSIETFQVYLLVGVVFYGYFSESILSGMDSLLGLAHIILKVQFPKQLAVLSSQGLALINFFFSLIILIAISLLNPIQPTLLSLLNFVYAISVLTVSAYSISLFSSVITVRFRDLKQIFEILLQLGFYLSPIIYPISLIPESYRDIYMLNPVTIVIQSARAALITGEVLYFKELTIIMLGALCVILIGRIYFSKFVKRVTEYY